MNKPTIYAFPHNYYPCRIPFGLKSTAFRESVECALATIQVALDESPVAEDWAQLLMAAPALAELGYGDVVLVSHSDTVTDIDLHWNWEEHAIRIARNTPRKSHRSV